MLKCEIQNGNCKCEFCKLEKEIHILKSRTLLINENVSKEEIKSLLNKVNEDFYNNDIHRSCDVIGTLLSLYDIQRTIKKAKKYNIYEKYLNNKNFNYTGAVKELEEIRESILQRRKNKKEVIKNGGVL